LPAEDKEVTAMSNNEQINGLLFEHSIMVGRVLLWCFIYVVIAIAIALRVGRVVDTATGFTVGAFVLAIAAVFLAFLSLVLTAMRR
jgi:hypothetical protein